MRLVESVRGGALAILVIFGLAACVESPLAPVPDASVSDPSLRAQVDRRGMVVSRRLKHFSRFRVWGGRGSYNVTSGFSDVLDGGNW